MITAPLAGVLATNNFGDTREGDGPAGPIALLIILVLAAATIFLIRNMNSRLRRLPDRFPTAADGRSPGSAADGAGSGSSAPEAATRARDSGSAP
jgi:hypothetical protein